MAKQWPISREMAEIYVKTIFHHHSPMVLGVWCDFHNFQIILSAHNRQLLTNLTSADKVARSFVLLCDNVWLIMGALLRVPRCALFPPFLGVPPSRSH